MTIRRFRRKVRCLLKHGLHGCPHIERHSRRPRRRPVSRAEAKAEPPGRHLLH